MKVYQGIEAFDPAKSNRPAVTLGMFDGVHLGHQKIFKTLADWAKENHAPSMVITFSSHPDFVLRKQTVPLISSMDDRLALMAGQGIQAVLVLAFTRELAAMTAEDFCNQILGKHIRARAVVLGTNARFGKQAAGSIKTLRHMETLGRFLAIEAPPVMAGDLPVSSTLIRKAIRKGDLEKASAMLGRAVSINGTVTHGHGRGKTLGFPTANLITAPGLLIPPGGVYATQIEIAGQTCESVTNIGTKPTFASLDQEDKKNTEAKNIIETHIMGDSPDLYDQRIKLYFIKRLRDERRFENAEDLKEQIRKDIQGCREL